MLAWTLLLATTAHATDWQQPPQEVLDVLHAPRLPWVWTAPTGGHLLLADPVRYPPLADFAAGWMELAGVRVDPRTGGPHNDPGGTDARLLAVGTDGPAEPVPLALPQGAELHRVAWSVDGERFALTVEVEDRFGLWVGDVSGAVAEVEGVDLHPLFGGAVDWMPDGKRLLVRARPELGPAPAPPAIPAGPMATQSSGGAARSTYEARNLLQTAHDEALFEHYMRGQLLLVHPKKGKVQPLGEPGSIVDAQPSPDGKYLLVEQLAPPWSHEVAWWRFGHTLEVWDQKGRLVKAIATLPLADNVPAHGVPEGPRGMGWRSTAPHELYWVEALDGGDPTAEVEHRDRVMRLDAPFTEAPEEVFVAAHRVRSWAWGEGSTLMLTERERIRRWRTTWLIDVDRGDRRVWYERDEGDAYNDPGGPLTRALPSGHRVLRQEGDAVYFSGRGASPDGDRPFLDLRSLADGSATRLFRSEPDRYEWFIAFAGEADQLVIRSESPTDVPNYRLATLGAPIADAADGEATRTRTLQPITDFQDPAPQVRALQKQLVTYERDDGVPLSFQLYLPPGYTEGAPLPTVVHAYPREFSNAATAGQVRGSTQRFDRLSASSPLFFALQGYAVLYQTAMPMLGDPETVYDTFVPQLVADAEAAVDKAVEMGVTDPDRVGVYGHSHGGLMVGNLLAHSDRFAAGVARSGSYNKTNQPFGFQSERRSLFEARDAYIALSPTFFADQVDEPILILHGDADSNPGTLTFQSEVFYEAIRGAGGTARLVLLPFEDHGYRAKETVEHVLWEELQWWDRYLRDAPPAEPASGEPSATE